MSDRPVRLPYGDDRELPRGCYFDDEEADRAVRFFSEHLKHTKGREFAGRPFELAEWQKIDIREVFGRMDPDGNRLIRQAYLEVPKKNGKSEIASGVGLKLTVADDEPGAEVYIAAADKYQAERVYDVAASMVKRDGMLSRILRPRDSIKRIVFPEWECYLQAVSADVKGKHGSNNHGVIFDEVHAQSDRRLWEVMTFGAGSARTQPLTWAITTAGVVGESPVAEELHEQADEILRGVRPCPPWMWVVLYGAGNRDPWDDEEVWRAANPAYGDFLSARAVRVDFETARERRSERNSFLRFRLNRWVGQEERWLDLDQWDECDGKPIDIAALKELPCCIGIDLSTRLDLTALVAVWLDNAGEPHWMPFYWIPADSVQDRANVEGDSYRIWTESGHLTQTQGSTIDYSVVRAKLLELRDEVGLNVHRVGFDPQFAHQLALQLQEDGFQMVEVRPTYLNFNESCDELEAALADRTLHHGGHPVLRWNADCVSVKVHPVSSMKIPIKPDRLKHRKRVDGIVAGLMGQALMIRNRPQTSVYEKRGLVWLGGGEPQKGA
jgi:phage terminase large subunit-like protein